MADLQTKNWTLDTYTNDTWTDLVDEPSTVASFIISATAEVTVSIRLSDDGNKLATILPPTKILENESHTLSVRSLNVTGTQTLQVHCNVSGAEFTASGVI